MKVRILIILSSLISFKTTLLAQNAGEIITKHIQAIGGAENWRKVNSMSITGNLNMQNAELTTTIRVLNQVGYREDLTVASFNGFIIMTPTNGWRYLPFTGQKTTESYSDEELKSAKLAVDISRLLDYTEKGHLVELLGYDTIDSKRCYRIKIVYKAGIERDLFIDIENYFLLRSSEKTALEDGEVAIISQDYSDYKKLPEGIVVPFVCEKNITVGSNTTQIFHVTYQSFSINLEIDKSIFNPDF